MAEKKLAARELAAELCAELNAAVEVEALAEAAGLNPNTIYCFGYKTKDQAPNLIQLTKMLDKAQETNPLVVVKLLKRLAARYGVWAEALETLGRDVRARE